MMKKREFENLTKSLGIIKISPKGIVIREIKTNAGSILILFYKNWRMKNFS